jgi:hypothetical protein
LMQHRTETSFIHMNFGGAMQCGEVKFASSLSICTGFITYIYIHIYIYCTYTYTCCTFVWFQWCIWYDIYIYMYTYLLIYHTRVSACHAKHQHSPRLPWHQSTGPPGRGPRWVSGGAFKGNSSPETMQNSPSIW